MGNRKQNLKKYLGRSEYPWSSCSDDDDEEQQPNQDVLQITDREPRPSTADMPGTSGSQSQSEQASPATARKMQDKIDRDLFWSIINNTPRSTNNISSSRSRMGVSPLASTHRSTTNDSQPQSSRSREEERNPDERTDSRRTGSLRTDSVRTDSTRSDSAHMERQPISEELQRIIAFKRLTRNLHHFTQHRGCTTRPSTLSQTSSRASRPQDRPGPASDAASRSTPGPSSGPTPTAALAAAIPVTAPAPTPAHRRLMGPCVGISPTEMLSPNNLLRYGYNNELPWRRSLPTYPPPATTQLQPRRTSWQCSPQPNPPNNAAIMDAPSTSQMPAGPFVHVLDPPEVDDTSPNETGSGARLIEEVVEVDAPDETDNNPPPPGTEGEEEVPEPTAENNNNNPETTTPEDNPEAAQQASSYQGMKRKRDTTDEASELFSVHEFNQSLLRLLECPVCLEWMEPPISQCRRGHLVCSRCRARLSACPVCRTPFSSVRNRAMEGVAEMLRYPCRHGCGREVRLRRRAPHEASCSARRYHCPAPACARHPALPRDELTHHFQCKHLPILKMGCKHKFSIKVNAEQHDTWIIMAMDEYFHLRVDVDMRSWGIIVFVAYIGPKRNVKSYLYEVTVKGQHHARKLVYTRATHSDLESSSINLNLSRQGCFHLIPEQTVNYLRFKNRHCEPEKILDFDIEISKWDNVDDTREDSES